MGKLEDMDASMCSTVVGAVSKRCLMQHARAGPAAVKRGQGMFQEEMKPLRVSEFAEAVESLEAHEEPRAPTLNLTLMGKAPRKGKTGRPEDEIRIDFANDSFLLDTASTNYMQNWNLDGEEVSEAAKPFIESELPAVEAAKAGVRFFGFKTTHAGMANVMSDRFWTNEPKTEGAFQVYAVQIFNVSDFLNWRYTITYTKTPPEALKVFPKDSKLTRSEAGNLYIVFSCDDTDQCNDDTIEISNIILSPIGKKMSESSSTVGAIADAFGRLR